MARGNTEVPLRRGGSIAESGNLQALQCKRNRSNRWYKIQSSCVPWSKKKREVKREEEVNSLAHPCCIVDSALPSHHDRLLQAVHGAGVRANHSAHTTRPFTQQQAHAISVWC